MADAEIVFTDIGLSLYRQVFYGFGHVLNDICASLWFTYLLVFFHLVLGFDAWQAGILMLVGQVADALATPFVGYCADQPTESLLCRYGRRKTWHLFGTLLVLGSFYFIFSPCLGCEHTHKQAQLVYYSAFIIIFQIGWAAVQVSHLSLIPHLTEDSAARTTLSAIRFGFTIFSNLFVYILTLLILHYAKSDDEQIGPDDAGNFNKIVIIGLFVGAPATILFHCTIRETTSDHPDHIAQTPPSMRYYLSVLTSRSFYLTASIYMCSRLIVNVSQAILPLYAHISLKLSARGVAGVPLALLGGSLAGAAFARWRLPPPFHRTPQAVSALIVMAASLWIHFGSGDFYSRYLVYCVSSLLGLGGGCMLVGAVALVGEMAGARNAAASLYGAMSFTDKMANGIAIAIIQNMASQGGQWFYESALLYTLLPAAILTVVCLIFLPKSSEDEDEEFSVNRGERASLIR